MRSISIKVRLALLVGFMGILLLVGGAIGISGIARTNAALESVYRDRLEPTILISKIMLAMQDNRAQVMLGIQHDPGNPFSRFHDHPLSAHVGNFVKNRDAITGYWENYMARTLSSQEKALSEKFAAARARYVNEGLAPAMAALQADDFGKANEIMLVRLNPLHKAVNEAAEEIFRTTTEAAHLEYETALQRYRTLRLISIGGTIVGLLLAALAGWLLIRSISDPLNRVIASFEQIAAGRLDQPVKVDRGDEMGRCLSALATMQQELRRTIGEIGQAASAIEQQSVALHADMENVAERSNSQMDRVQEVAAAMEEVSQSVSEVAGSAEQTAVAADDSQHIVDGSHRQMTSSMAATERVVQVVESASTTIQELSAAILRVDQVTHVIQEIADQTNLLALNAAIEAARAGEQGRGFAVVADEVRKLAERTTASTTDISSTVGTIQEVTRSAVTTMGQAVREVEESIGLLKASGESVAQIATTSTHVSAMSQHIAAATKQQSVASQEVARNMEQLSELIGQNNASAQRASQTSTAMYRAAQGLRSLVVRFQV
ncbi:hypothetical protein B9N43_14300 [Denitratisoma sp. DHT3]|uniref:methyl-accepting chemotaxis protein n=1 Tax=Denitratisoma sp. DHT3 TaxID=1981880 RepID=UPI001198C3DF|nr:methyl-accepting chemotaxis protein [Denitratisoma sp. DHT3]QDX82306.1 hypothetical protein B9N43_14300 [Denitratisoma sp. DHT3]